MGVVGVGALGFHHVRILRELRDAELVGFHDIDDRRAREVASTLGVRAFDRLDDLVAASDALTIAVPTPAHHAVAARALARGRHLLVEKPIAATLEEADDLLRRAEDSGALVQIGHVERFNRAVRAALPYVDRPRFIDSDRLAPFSPRGADVAVVLDLMIHDIDLVLTLVREEVTALAAVGVAVLTPSVDIANARLVFASGAVANITSSRISRDRMRKVRIFQPSGYLSLDLASGTGEFYRLRADVDPGMLRQGPLALESFVERETLEASDDEPLRVEIERFIDALHGRQPVAVSGADGRAALAVALRIVDDIERGGPALAGLAGLRAG